MQSSAASPGRASSPWTELAERADSNSRQRPAAEPDRGEEPREARFERSLEQQRQAAQGQRQASRRESREGERDPERRAEDPSSEQVTAFVQTQALTTPEAPRQAEPAPAVIPAAAEALQPAAPSAEVRTTPGTPAGLITGAPADSAGPLAQTPGSLPATPGLGGEIVASAPQRGEAGPAAATAAAERVGPGAPLPAQSRPEAPPTPAPAAAQPSAEAPASSEPLQLEGLRLEIDPDQRNARLELEPAELGRVSVQLELRAKSVRALLRVESKEALEALRNQLPELRQAFEARGLAVQQLELSFDPRGAASGQRSPDEAPTSPRRQRLRISAATPNEPHQPAPLSPTPRPVRPGGIDTLA
jgi:flagellar hook-length control protein FliK